MAAPSPNMATYPALICHHHPIMAVQPLLIWQANPDWSRRDVRDAVRSRAFDLIAHPIRIDPSVFEFFASK
eukprot:2381892-Prymnesium_polylepis.1